MRPVLDRGEVAPVPPAEEMSVLYDAGVLIAAERNDRTISADHRARLEAGTVPATTAPVVAQVSRTPQQVQLRVFLRGARPCRSLRPRRTTPVSCWRGPAVPMWSPPTLSSWAGAEDGGADERSW